MIVLDLDGSVADNTWRQHLIPEDKSSTEQWAEFNKACEGDTLISPVWEMIHHIYWHSGHAIYVVTGRSEVCREETIRWLKKYGIKYTLLIMRPNHDHRKAVDFKREKFKELQIKAGDLVVEDDPAIIKMLQEEFNSIVMAVPSKCGAVLTGNSQEGSEQK
jgi:predicted secreted acid phosphatase